MTETLATEAPIERAIARVLKIYSRWRRSTSEADMRRDWEELFWNDDFPASVTPVDAGGVPGMWLDAPGVAPGKVMLYLHGGGFRLGSVRSHRDLIARLSAAAGCRALGIDYRLVPEQRYPAQIDDVLAAWHWLLGQGYAPRDIAFVGDSAGANLALAAALVLRGRGEALPAAIAVMSVWTDLASTGASYRTHAALDPIHQPAMMEPMARHYLGPDVALDDPAASPYYADLHGLPPLLMQVGAREIIVDDTRNFAAKAQAAGVAVEVEVWDNMIHVFQQFTAELPEALAAIDSIGRFLRRYLQISSTQDK